MKTTAAVVNPKDSAPAGAQPRYHVYRQGPAGNYHPEFATDSASEAVEAFLAKKPAFEGGAVHLWDRQEQRSGASVRWSTAKTEFGFAVTADSDSRVMTTSSRRAI